MDDFVVETTLIWYVEPRASDAGIFHVYVPVDPSHRMRRSQRL